MAYGRFGVKSEKTNALLKEIDFLAGAAKWGGLGPSSFKNKECKVHAVDRGDVVDITIGYPNYYIIRFSINSYPACCGIMMLHNFAVRDTFDQETLDKVLNTFFEENRYGPRDAEGNISYLLGRNGRLEVVMVECRSLADKLRVPEADIEPIDDPNIVYKPLWNYFHKHAKKVRTSLYYNNNSGNILHNMEVILF